MCEVNPLSESVACIPVGPGFHFPVLLCEKPEFRVYPPSELTVSPGGSANPRHESWSKHLCGGCFANTGSGTGPGNMPELPRAGP